MTNTAEIAQTTMRHALERARSTDPEILRALHRDLISTEFLNSLDSADDYNAAASQRLRISRVVEALARNPHPIAQAAFVALLDDSVFTNEEERIDVLILASAFVASVDPQLAAFWDRHSQTDDGYTSITIAAILEQGSSEALQLFEAKMLDPTHEDDVKVGWLRSCVVLHRDDTPLLTSVSRLLKPEAMSDDLSVQLVEVIYDYKPEAWYRPANVKKPPNRDGASHAARQLLVDIGNSVLNRTDFPKPLRDVVQEVINEQKTNLTLP